MGREWSFLRQGENRKAFSAEVVFEFKLNELCQREGVSESAHTVSFQLVNRPSFVKSQNNARCTCLLQNLAFCDPKGKPPAELDKDGSIVTGLLC